MSADRDNADERGRTGGAAENGLLSRRKIIIQLLGFSVGVALLYWCIAGAISKGGWEDMAEASPLLIAALLACTLVSAFLNGTSFWLTIRPVKPLRFADMQLLNLVANMLNYAPVRLGAVARVLYHLRIDRLNLLQIGGWFSIIAYFLFLGVGSCFLATIVRGQVDWIWALLVLGQMALGGFFTRVAVGNRILVEHGRGIHQILASQPVVWGAIGLRLLDLAAYTGRMAVAMKILSIALPTGDVIILALVALAASLIPFGRLGFREFCVASAAAWLGTQSDTVEANMQALALLESAGEALVFIPLGAVALLWYRKRWVSTPPVTSDNASKVA